MQPDDNPDGRPGDSPDAALMQPRYISPIRLRCSSDETAIKLIAAMKKIKWEALSFGADETPGTSRFHIRQRRRFAAGWSGTQETHSRYVEY
jgi:hypothetical protein